MKLILKQKPKGVILINGFPGFGLIGTIGTEFLVEHLKTEKIGSVEMDEVPAVVAIHDGKVVEPVSIHYNKKFNIVLLHAINVGNEQGWKMADIVKELAEQLTAKEIITLEGVGSQVMNNQPDVYYFTSEPKKVNQLKAVAKPMTEGVVVGVAGALLVKEKRFPITALFAETHSQLPDSKAAAMIIKALDQYLGLDVDYKPLLKQAEIFESKLKGMFEKSKEATDLQEKKKLNYVG
ncbi:proteasome assembly chaperone family protein [Candidatus Woesearchaeota archaeon]|nr:proteasome assembly chaperone family protein [Candidatus Woesearchaeota archaeon]